MSAPTPAQLMRMTFVQRRRHLAPIRRAKMLRDLLEVERRHVNPEAERRRVQDTPDRTAARRAVLVAESLWHERNCACLATLNGRRPA